MSLTGGDEVHLTERPRPLRFRLEPRDGVCTIAWHGGADCEADDLVRKWSPAERADREEVRCLLQEAMDLLRNILADGPQPRSMCYLRGQCEGYSRRTMERAVKALGLRTSFAHENTGGEARYELPPEPAPNSPGGVAGGP